MATTCIPTPRGAWLTRRAWAAYRGYIGLELAAQGVVGPGAQQRVMEVATKYACPVQ